MLFTEKALLPRAFFASAGRPGSTGKGCQVRRKETIFILRWLSLRAQPFVFYKILMDDAVDKIAPSSVNKNEIHFPQ
ncbi:hypothetical protein [uncultured Desulfovibrio sp.]|uniref:hypothetical protein n=1 Tax=uncultured Desulfovibrio sp. TaxID=167968 RepID=UPI0028038F88|nr:hypothetical protein [uncultured Desulfovibrio sp.]